jgi:hypothetical protein
MLLWRFGAIICSDQETLETPTVTLTFAQTPSWSAGFRLRGCVPLAVSEATQRSRQHALQYSVAVDEVMIERRADMRENENDH